MKVIQIKSPSRGHNVCSISFDLQIIYPFFMFFCRTSAEYHCRQPAMCNIKLQTHENPQLQINKLNLFFKRYFHASSVTQIFRNTEFDEVNMGIKMRSSKWNKYNTVVYPPTEEEHPIRPAVCIHLYK